MMLPPPVSLWEALGSPPLDGLLPHPRAPAWLDARRSLRRALQELGVLATTPRSPSTLWTRIHATRCPPGCTWGALCGQVPLARLADLLPVAPGTRPRLCTWNVRSLRSGDTAEGAERRARLTDAVVRGCIVAVQETHWTPGHCDLWAGAFATGRVLSAPARPGPEGGHQGGVAILVPIAYTILGHRILLPGCCLEATLQRPGDDAPFCVRSLYLPPDDRHAVLAALAALPPPPTRASRLVT